MIHNLWDVQIGENDDRNEKLFSNDERDKLVSYISKWIHNMSLQVSGKWKQCHYPSHAINLSMSLYFKNKSVYKEIRETKGMPLPSLNLLYDK